MRKDVIILIFMEQIREQISEVVARLFGVNDIKIELTDVPSEIAGDYACNVAMRLARQVGKSPRQIAEEIIAELSKASEYVFSVAGPGFINVEISGRNLQAALAAQWSEHYGDNDSGTGKTALVEFPSTNIAKPYSVGHLRPGTQGWAAKMVLEANGWQVTTDNHLGDVGTPFGVWAVGFRRSGKNIDEVTVYDLGQIYIHMQADLTAEAKAGKHNLADEVQSWLLKLEAKDPEAVALSTRFKEISLQHTHEVMGRLRIATASARTTLKRQTRQA